MRPSLASRLPAEPARDAEDALGRFLGWVADLGLEPFPHQEEALLELAADRHVVLGTPTGSGKSLVAEFLHFKALCEGRRSFYTGPVKALVSEKFFSLCDDFGPERVGMLTGDASINPNAPLLCCTTEVLANMALRHGEDLDAPYVVMDEFHYYADHERGPAWQIPLLTLPHTRFLLMSATLGNTAPIEERLRDATGREVAHVFSDQRPVPLDFEYRETPILETIETLLDRDQAPLYVVNFTQRECAEMAQGLTSARICSKDERRRVAERIAGFRFDTPFGRELQRYLRHGIGVHNAGLLPKYRLLVEQLAQRGLLKVVCGTDTLGVGVNIPIRTVVFTKLCKFDGEKVSILSVREFKQIAGRAGRKGFDDRGGVVCQAPEHVIESRRRRAKGGPRGRRKAAKKRPPPRNFVPWNRDTFRRLVERPPETLVSRFGVTHGMLVNVLQRGGRAGGYAAVIDLVNRSHEGPGSKARLRRRAAMLFRSLRRAGILRLVYDADAGTRKVRVARDLQSDFSLHRTLSLFLFDTVSALDPEEEDYAMDVLSLVEAIQENPNAILFAQAQKRRRELWAELKAKRVPFEERIRQTEDVSWPQPQAELVHEAFHLFAEKHPWVRDEDIRPKSIAREMAEEYRGFVDYVREYRIARSEGLLLRYLSQVHNTLVQTVPKASRTEALFDVMAYLRTLVQRVDSSLVEAWERLLAPPPGAPEAGEPFDLARQPKLLAARVRAEMHALVRALASGELEEAAAGVRQDPEDPWNARRFGDALAPFLAEHGEVVFTPRARQARHTLLKATGPRTWDVFQTLVDPRGDLDWAVEGCVDLSGQRDPEGPLVRLRRIGP